MMSMEEKQGTEKYREKECTRIDDMENDTKKHNSYKQLLKKMFSIKEDAAPHDEIRERLLSGGKVTGTNMVVMVCAILIASVGLNTDSVAVIIGAMLISPLMGSILAMAYGTASNDMQLTLRHGIGFLMQILFSVLSATVYFVLSPAKEPTAQIIARTSPTFFDVIVAVAGGVAGIVGQTREDKSNNIIPGVAIATALMPPLCTCGYAIANDRWRMLGGAAYLFVINMYFIYMSACAVLTALEIPLAKEMTDTEKKRHIKLMRRNTLVVLLPMIVAFILLARK